MIWVRKGGRKRIAEHRGRVFKGYRVLGKVGRGSASHSKVTLEVYHCLINRGQLYVMSGRQRHSVHARRVGGADLGSGGYSQSGEGARVVASNAIVVAASMGGPSGFRVRA